MNLSGLLGVFEELGMYKTAAKQLSSAELLPLSLPRSIRSPFLARTAVDSDAPILLLTGRVNTVPLWIQALETWLPSDQIPLHFPEPTPLPYDRAPWSDDSRNGRMAILTRLMAGQHPLLPAQRPPLIVTSIRALLHKTVPKRILLTRLTVLKLGQIIDVEKMLNNWSANGYKRVQVVELPCQFSQRGGIIDIFPASAPYPVRIELFGDEVDTLRYFDPITQRSVEGDVTRIVISPAREALPDLAMPIGEKLSAFVPEDREDDLPSWEDDVSYLQRGQSFPTLELYLPYLYKRCASLLDYLPNNTKIIVDDWVELQAAVGDFTLRVAQVSGNQINLPPELPSPIHAWDKIAAELLSRHVTVLGDIVENVPILPQDAPVTMADLVQPSPQHGGQERPFIKQLQRAVELDQCTVVVSRQAQRLIDLWNQSQEKTVSTITAVNAKREIRPLTSLPHLPKQLTFVQGTLTQGFILEDEEGNVLLNLLTDAEIFGWSRPAPRRRNIQRSVSPETYFSDIEPGHYVVHVDHGVGQYVGMVKRNLGGGQREYLHIQYQNNDVIFLPIHHADRISKWVGSEINAPPLHRIGSKKWSESKKRAKKAIADMADELLELYAAREQVSGHAYSKDEPWQNEMEAAFKFQETDDQLRSIKEVKADMEQSKPMDRLLCGDVGFGKTEVALRAAFKAVMDGKQVAILVPTTVLAQQHYHNFQDRYRPFPVKVGTLSRFRTPAQNSQTINQLRNGEIDVVIGTHRLVSDDVSFKDLGLIIIDEEQRFGVKHKEKLKKIRHEVDVLTMTATPIPRTLYMGLSGLRDISTITTAPTERLPVQTYVGKAEDELIKRALLRELDRGGQIFFIHNRIQTIRNVQILIENIAPAARVAIGHGQMNEGELEEVMRQFAAHEIDVLISTTIVESGLDIPNANTLIVDKAELFGLSQLYQLRGRVGRGMQRAYAYFFHSSWSGLTPEAKARLETLDEHQELGAGYAIAMRDLEIRGAGDLLGGSQSGHIESIGFDLYTRLLAQAVKTRKALMKGQAVTIGSHALVDAIPIDLPLPAYMPMDYAPDASLRLRLYRRMAALMSFDEINEMASELEDRFGNVPDPVTNLLYQLRIKLLAGSAGVRSILTDKGQIYLRLKGNKLEQVDLRQLQRFLGGDVRVTKSTIWLDPSMSTHEWKIKLVQLLEKLAQREKGMN